MEDNISNPDECNKSNKKEEPAKFFLQKKFGGQVKKYLLVFWEFLKVRIARRTSRTIAVPKPALVIFLLNVPFIKRNCF